LNIFDIGTGIAEITDPAIGGYMAGMSDSRQRTKGICWYSKTDGRKSRLYARAFVIADRESGKRVAVVSADLWACTHMVKLEVVAGLQSLGAYDFNNVLISGTHTHSGPAGFTYYKLYDPAPDPFDKITRGFSFHTFKCITEGIITAIKNAHSNLAPGKIYYKEDKINEPCGKQRSKPAYGNNPESERKTYDSDTDDKMLLLKFVALDKAGELPIGEINWYPIHPTDLGQFNYYISGDNKGCASYLFEKEMETDYFAKDTFVAAFANSNCGDVSGNVGRTRPNENTAPKDDKKDSEDEKNMKEHGRIQKETALSLFKSAAEELWGSVDYRLTYINMANVDLGGGKKTYPAALGLSFAAGSQEDSAPDPNVGAFEGITRNTRAWGGLSWELSDPAIMARSGLAAIFGTTSNSKKFIDGHTQKPIVFAPGLLEHPILPSVLPIQILKIGNLVIAGIPGEITTMAGRRLKQTILDELSGFGVEYLALAAYANDYSQYITTKEEYDMQHYEGASTLFGPYTLEAYQKNFKDLANTLKNGMAAPKPAFLPDLPLPPLNRRITIRNLSTSTKTLEFFDAKDPMIFGGVPILEMTISVPPGDEVAQYISPTIVSDLKVKISGGQKTWVPVRVGTLITIQANGTMNLSDNYTPPVHNQSHKSTIGRKGAVPAPITTNGWLQPVLHMISS
jgi:neutral ceramidase